MVKWGYAFIRCPACKRKLKIRIGQKYRLCPYCNRQIKIRK